MSSKILLKLYFQVHPHNGFWGVLNFIGLGRFTIKDIDTVSEHRITEQQITERKITKRLLLNVKFLNVKLPNVQLTTVENYQT